jgi:hypothetical protein
LVNLSQSRGVQPITFLPTVTTMAAAHAPIPTPVEPEEGTGLYEPVR